MCRPPCETTCARDGPGSRAEDTTAPDNGDGSASGGESTSAGRERAWEEPRRRPRDTTARGEKTGDGKG